MDQSRERNDAERIQALLGEDSKEFDRLFRYCLYIVAKCIHRTDIDGEQIALDACKKILDFLDKQQSLMRPLETVVWRITRNKCYDYLRSEIIKGADGVVRWRIETVPLDSVSPEENVEELIEDQSSKDTDPYAREREILYFCLNTLTTFQKVVYDFFMQGYLPSEIALKLIPPTTRNNVSVTWHNIRRKLKDCCEQRMAA